MKRNTPSGPPSKRSSFMRGMGRALGGLTPPRRTPETERSDLEEALIEFAEAVDTVTGKGNRGAS